MVDMAKLISELKMAHFETRRLLNDLDAVQGANRELYPTWTVKELLAHLTGWDDACIATLRALAGGTAPATPASHGFDSFNAATVLAREALPLQQVIQEWEATRSEFLQVLQDLPEEKAESDFVYPWGPKGGLAGFVEIFVEHELEHAEEIRRKILR